MSTRITNADKKIINKQLGREARGLRAVVNRCSKGCPTVVLTNVFLSDGTPFPTIFWLTCPELRKRISQIEGDGGLREIQLWVECNPLIKRELIEAHQNYIAYRYLLVDGADKNHAVFQTGVGGVNNLLRIKCLHAHYAHYLATGLNAIGKLIHHMVGRVNCPQDCYKN
jgi:hypothetical protein